ncbi:hypothetical protein ACQY0O_002567 [Thecaphora frezii]
MALLLFHLPTLILNQTATLLFPLYASYKAVTSHSRRTSTVSSYSWSSVLRPVNGAPHSATDPATGAGAAGSESVQTELAEMEHWLIYWSVFACLALVESTVGWTWSWFPFYYELRLVFNLWLVLPQTRGATWLYINHLHPFLQSQEEAIDEFIESVKARIREESKNLLGKLWGGAWAESIGQTPSTGAGAGAGAGGSYGMPPASNPPSPPPKAALSSLLGKLAPYAAASAASFLEKAQASASLPAHHTTRAAALQTEMEMHQRTLDALGSVDGIAPEPQRTLQRAQALARKRQLEQQLAALNQQQDPTATATATGTAAAAAAAGGTDGGVRNRNLSGALSESFDFVEGLDGRPDGSST